VVKAWRSTAESTGPRQPLARPWHHLELDRVAADPELDPRCPRKLIGPPRLLAGVLDPQPQRAWSVGRGDGDEPAGGGEQGLDQGAGRRARRRHQQERLGRVGIGRRCRQHHGPGRRAITHRRQVTGDRDGRRRPLGVDRAEHDVPVVDVGVRHPLVGLLRGQAAGDQPGPLRRRLARALAALSLVVPLLVLVARHGDDAGQLGQRHTPTGQPTGGQRRPPLRGRRDDDRAVDAQPHPVRRHPLVGPLERRAGGDPRQLPGQRGGTRHAVARPARPARLRAIAAPRRGDHHQHRPQRAGGRAAHGAITAPTTEAAASIAQLP
jgi:hypothetical protein